MIECITCTDSNCLTNFVKKKKELLKNDFGSSEILQTQLVQLFYAGDITIGGRTEVAIILV